jgi:hypothetical protein
MSGVAVALLLFAALTQTSAEVRGIVRDAAGGEPLARVEVTLAGTSHRAVSDSAGRFTIAGISPGEYVLHVSTVGYRLLTKPFALSAGEVKEFEIVLSPEMFRHTERVEVTAGLFEPLVSSSPSERALTGPEIKNLASVLADDPLRAVQGLPGATSNDDFNSRFSLRGADYHRLGLYLDGILLHAPFHMVAGEPASGSLTAFQGDTLEAAVLLPGAWPSRYGDRTGGIVDLRTREGSRLVRSLRLTGSASNSGLLAEGPLGRRRRGAWLASVRKSYLQYIIRRTTDDPTLAFGFTDAQAKLSYDLSTRHSLSMSVVEAISDLDRARARNRLGLNSVMLGDYHVTIASLGWRATLAPKGLLESRLAFLRESYDNRNRDRRSLAGGRYVEWAWTGTGLWSFSPAASLEAGWSLRRPRDNGFRNWYEFSPFAVQRRDDYRGRAVQPALFAVQSWSPAGGRVRLSAGARWERHSVGPLSVLLPHASLGLGVREGTQISLGWGQYAQFPEIQWLFARIGSPGLLAERATHYLAAIEQQVGPRARLRAEFYSRHDRDLLFRPLLEPRIQEGRIFNPPLDAPVRNSVRGYARGFEVFLQQRSASRLSGWIAYAYGRARLREGETGTHFAADHDQRHTVNAYGSYRVRPSVNVSARWSYGSGFPIPGFLRRDGGTYFLAAARNEVRLKPYQRADLRVNKAFAFDRWKLTLYGEVVNVFNRENFRFDTFSGYHPQTGRAFVVLDKMFPILPSAGVMLEFEARQ